MANESEHESIIVGRIYTVAHLACDSSLDRAYTDAGTSIQDQSNTLARRAFTTNCVLKLRAASESLATVSTPEGNLFIVSRTVYFESVPNI